MGARGGLIGWVARSKISLGEPLSGMALRLRYDEGIIRAILAMRNVGLSARRGLIGLGPGGRGDARFFD